MHMTSSCVSERAGPFRIIPIRICTSQHGARLPGCPSNIPDQSQSITAARPARTIPSPSRADPSVSLAR